MTACLILRMVSTVHLGRRQRQGRRLVVAQLAQAGAGPLDGETLVVEQVADAQEQLDVLPAIQPLPATASSAA